MAGGTGALARSIDEAEAEITSRSGEAFGTLRVIASWIRAINSLSDGKSDSAVSLPMKRLAAFKSGFALSRASLINDSFQKLKEQ